MRPAVRIASPKNTTINHGLGRRIVKKGGDSGDWDCTTVYYYDGQKLIETHNGSEQVIKQHLWGLQYIDELVQIAVNDDPADAGEDDCESVYYACHNANFNVLGVVDDSGDLVERYEYTPYGERVVFVNSGTGDADTSAPALESARVVTAGSVTQPYGLCDVGHQGLIHDKETGLIYNRARMHTPRLGRFMQRDPLRYVDGMGLYEYVGSVGVSRLDPHGNKWVVKRYGQSRALATNTKCDDTIDDLAWKLRLDPDDHEKWAINLSPLALPHDPKQPVHEKFLISIPNKVIIDIGARYSFKDGSVLKYRLEHLFFGLDTTVHKVHYDFIDTLRRRADKVGWLVEKHTWGKPGDEDPIKMHMADKDLAAYVYTGHGAAGSLYYAYGYEVDEKSGKTRPVRYSTPPGRYAHHRLAFLGLLSCSSMVPSAPHHNFAEERTQPFTTFSPEASIWELNVSQYGKVVGYDSDIHRVTRKWSKVSRSGGLELKKPIVNIDTAPSFDWIGSEPEE